MEEGRWERRNPGFLPSCREVQALLLEGSEKRFPVRVWLWTRIHWLLCPPCRRLHRGLAGLARLVRACEDPDPEVPGEARKALEEAMKIIRSGAQDGRTPPCPGGDASRSRDGPL
jgi:hypothetical protein